MFDDPIDALLNREIPEKLWHYTSVRGFHGIVTSKAVFATDTRFLNDRKEFIHAREIACEVVADTPELGSHLFPARVYLGKAVDLAFNTGQLDPNRLQVFVASFSAAEDQLSQWRGYSQGSSGVSLAFRLGSFRPSAEADTLVCFAPCVYDLKDKKALVRHALNHFVKVGQGYWDATTEAFYNGPRPAAYDPASVMKIIEQMPETAKFNERLGTAIVKMQADLLRIAALLKDESFHEEQEWRLVLPVSAGKGNLQNPRRFRPENIALVPYIAYPFPTDSAGAPPLVDVILGPGSHPNATQAVLAFLESERIRVLPRESKVPYRPW
ncbi:MAG TPA: DUF2971 domain-containing protein [Candidatus Dormibacteraeota bacterium]|jgi:hypothetical protein|nr:DUF2971 domain-containing protein [Candidatus Dormibacteraeota bacterium]